MPEMRELTPGLQYPMGPVAGERPGFTGARSLCHAGGEICATPTRRGIRDSLSRLDEIAPPRVGLGGMAERGLALAHV